MSGACLRGAGSGCAAGADAALWSSLTASGVFGGGSDEATDIDQHFLCVFARYHSFIYGKHPHCGIHPLCSAGTVSEAGAEAGWAAPRRVG